VAKSASVSPRAVYTDGRRGRAEFRSAVRRGWTRCRESDGVQPDDDVSDVVDVV